MFKHVLREKSGKEPASQSCYMIPHQRDIFTLRIVRTKKEGLTYLFGKVCEVDKVEHLIPKLFKRIVKCIGGIHLQVADRAMCFFENDYFLNILKTYKEKTFPMLVPIIVDLAENHWHKIL